MANCLVAQSGGPTAVINASLAGVIRANQLNPVYDRVYGGLHGIEGVLDDKLYDLTDLPGHEIEILKQSPSSALGTCRYKLKRGNDTDFKRLVEIMDKHDIEVMFYIGGNDSMDTVDALSEWAQAHNMPQRFVGIPKTVDNDLVPVDHCPGFPSAAKIANQIVHATYLDYAAYTRPEVFIVETMGRDAGWLAASCCVTGDVDLVVLPEVDFDKEAFLAEVKKKFDEKGECYIVVSEGAHYADGTYLSAGDTANDGFAHAVLGGAGLQLKQMIIDSGIVPRGVVQDLSRAARSSNFAQSLTDVTEAYELGMSAHMRSANPAFTAQVVGIERETDEAGNYCARYFAKPACEFANFVKHFPTEWILPNYQGITQEAIDYFKEEAIHYAWELLTTSQDEGGYGFDPEKLCVVSPDVGRAKAAKKFQTMLGSDIAIMHKDRPRHNQAEITALIGDVTGKICILNDDMIDTAGSLVAAAETLKAKGAAQVFACATHGIFSGPAYERIANSCIEEVVVTNVIPVPLERQTGKIKVLSVAPLFAKTIRNVYENGSVASLFE